MYNFFVVFDRRLKPVLVGIRALCLFPRLHVLQVKLIYVWLFKIITRLLSRQCWRVFGRRLQKPRIVVSPNARPQILCRLQAPHFPLYAIFGRIWVIKVGFSFNTISLLLLRCAFRGPEPSKILVGSVHPGIVATLIYRYVFPPYRFMINVILAPILRFLSHTNNYFDKIKLLGSVTKLNKN